MLRSLKLQSTEDVIISEIPDHEDTYSYSSIINIIHRNRLKTIRKICVKHFHKKTSYADFGCSNGYVTNFIIEDNKFLKSMGFDYIPELIDEGNSRFDFEIRHLNLNLGISPGQFQNVSCFETLEHVTDLDVSVKTIVDSITSGGRGIITVPIEIGPIGTLKYLVKILIFRYPLEELQGSNVFWRYLFSLLKNERMSKYRILHGNKEWSWHFGFDYRDITDSLENMNVKFRFKKIRSSAIFLIEK